MDDDQQFCLRWNNHQSTLISVFDTLLENETLVDCTLAAEGKFLKAHKVVLSACSPYFATLLQEQYDKHPIFILKDVKYQELRAMMDYMYRGEVNISQDQLAALLKAAESLQIKGLSDNRSGGGSTAPKPEHHRATMPTGKLSAGYTLEQTKRARIAGPAEPEMGSREGSSSPSRRRRKVRRRSIENAMTDVHDNSNSSQQHQQQLQQTQSNASGLGAITAAASALAAAAAASAPNVVPSLASTIPLSASTSSSSAVTAAPGTTLSSSKKTDIVKGTTQQQQQTQQLDAMNTENVQGSASAVTAAGTGSLDTETTDITGATTATASEKSNHKQKQSKDSLSGGAGTSSTELVIEPKAEYDDDANDEPVEDLTLDEEDMGMDDLDQNAGTSQGGEGSSQGYAPWQHDRSQDELLLATQEAQQRDPQDLTQKLAQIHKENTAPNQVQKIQKSLSRSILNNNPKRSNSRNSLHNNDSTNNPAAMANGKNKRLSMSDVSDMLYEFYRANAAAKTPKTTSQTAQQPQTVMVSGATAAAVKYVGQTSPTSAETEEPSSIAAIATETASKNLQGDEMMSNKLAASFHPRIKLTNTKVPTSDTINNECNTSSITSIPTSVVVPAANNAEPLDIKPIINPTTGLVITPNPSVIKPVPQTNTPANPQAAAIAAALIRDGYHSFQQQMRAQELIKFHTGKINKHIKTEDSSTTKILETFLRQQRNSECDDTNSDNNDGDDEDDSRYNGFEDIHLMEGSKTQFPHLLHNVMANNSTPGTPAPGDYFSDESQKYMSLAAQAQAQAFRNLEYSLGDFGNTSPNDSANMGPTGIGPDGEPVYECRHCGKKYRWKSTLRRHENVECGGKEPSHQCPYCPYKSKQRGNLGVHVRKHHSNLPQLASKRRSKYSVKYESNPSSANVSDDSNSKLIIDCSK